MRHHHHHHHRPATLALLRRPHAVSAQRAEWPGLTPAGAGAHAPDNPAPAGPPHGGAQ